MAKASIAITTNNKMSPGLAQAKKQLLEFQQTTQQIGTALKAAFSVAAVTKFAKELKNLATEYMTVEKSLTKITAASSLYGTSISKSTSLITELSKVSLESNTSITELVSSIAALGKSDDDINKIARASVSLANVTGKSLTESMNQLINSTTGELGELKKLGTEFTSLTKEQLEHGDAIDIVIDKYEELSKSMATASQSQQWKNISDAFTSIKQQGGKLVLEIAENTGFTAWLETTLNKILQVISLVSDKNIGLTEFFSNALTSAGITNPNSEDFQAVSQTNLGGHYLTTPETEKFIEAYNLIYNSYAEQYRDLYTRYGDLIPTTELEKLSAGLPEALEPLMDILTQAKDARFTTIDNTMAISTYEQTNAKLTETIGKINDKITNLSDQYVSLKERRENYDSDSAAYKAVTETMQKIEKDIATYEKNILSKNEAIIKNNLEIERLQQEIVNMYDISRFVGDDTILNSIISIISGLGLDSESVTEAVAEGVEQGLILYEPHHRTTGGGGINSELAEPSTSLYERFTSYLFDSGTGLLSGLSSGLQGVLGSGLDSIVSSLGIFGDLLSGISIEFAILKPVIEGFVSTFGTLVSTTIAPIEDALHYLGQALAEIFIPIFDALAPYMYLISQVVMEIANVLMSVLYPVMELIGGLMQILAPVLEVLVKGVVTVTGTFEWVGQYLKHWIAMLLNWFASIEIFGKRPFAGMATTDPGAPEKLTDYIAAKWASLNEGLSATNSSSVGEAVSTSTAVSSAGYQGATQVTINIYQEAPVVGDGGMRAFASMIKDEFDALSYYGVTG